MNRHRRTPTSSTLHTSSCPSSPSSPSSFSGSRILWTTVWVVVTLALMIQQTEGAVKEDYDRLLKDLFTNYSVDIRPVNDYDTATIVYMGLLLLSIVEVNEKDQTLKTNTLLDIEWDDVYLAWDPGNHQNISSILKKQEDLWLPDLVVSNTVSSQKRMGYDDLKMRIESDGIVVWNPSGVFETACDIDITYYPFDTQVCNIEFQTAMSVKSEVYAIIDEKDPIDLSSYSENGLWLLTSSSAENVAMDDYYTKTKIRFKLQLQRRRSYYILNIILPILLLSMTSSLTFALPSDSGEKMGLSITVLLAFAVYLTLVTEAMPTTSVQVSVVTVYLILLLALTSASVVLSVFILRLHHRPPSRPITGCLAALLPTLRACLFMTPIPQDELEEERLKVDEVTKITTITQEHDNANKQDPLPHKTLKSPSTKRSHHLNSVSPEKVLDLSFDTSSTSKSKVKAVSGRRAAETLDKFVFLLFTSLSLLGTVLCLAVLFIGASKQASSTKLP